MTKRYTTPEEFIADGSFVRYCFHQNEDDVHFWESWISEHPDQQKNIEQAIQLIESLAIKPTHHNKLREWKKLKKETEIQADHSISAKNSGSRLRILWQIAAAVALLLIITGVAVRLLNNTTAAQVVYQTGPGESKQIVLPDQTKVWLNADSKLICGEKFEQSGKRVVILEGEAFFDVQKDQNTPFIIHADQLKIEVLGTTFNVRAYPEASTTSTTLISGAIQVSLKNESGRKVRLQPKEKFVIDNRSITPPEDDTMEQSVNKLKGIDALHPTFKIAKVMADPLLNNEDILETAWMDDKLAFRNERFADLALQLSHKYGVQFRFSSEKLKDYRFTGIFTQESLKEVLHALQLTSPSHPFQYKINGDNVVIEEQ